MKVRLTKKLLGNVVIVASDKRDRHHPHLCKVVTVDPESGKPGQVLSDDHRDRGAAETWIEAEKTMAPAE